jgi:hypothetical protein
MHAVMDALGPWLVVAGDAGFQIDDAQLRLVRNECAECISPHVIKTRRHRNRGAATSRKFKVIARIAHLGFVQNGIGRMRKDLVDAAPEHDIAAQEQAH